MSIATVSVLRRILDDVRECAARAAPPVALQLDAGALGAQGDTRLWCFETAEVGSPPFATALHFWGHALFAFLAARGEEAHFDALAGNGLCEAVGDDRAGQAFGRLAPAAPVWRAGFDETYCMIDQPVFVSFVGETPARYRAGFWQADGWAASNAVAS